MKVLSLFDGIGCCRIALERAGVIVDKYYASEIEKSAIKIATTNYPEEINKSILKSDKFAIIAGLPNPDETNMANVIKYYATGFAESDIDYLEIAKSIINKNPQKSYSNASIERILKDFYNNNRNVANFKITKEDIIRLFTINNKLDITQKELKLFQKQIALLKNIG